MRSSDFSTDDERWPLVAALTWIVTRSLKFAEAHVTRDIGAADALLFAGRSSEGVPPGAGNQAQMDNSTGTRGDNDKHDRKLELMLAMAPSTRPALKPG